VGTDRVPSLMRWYPFCELILNSVSGLVLRQLGLRDVSFYILGKHGSLVPCKRNDGSGRSRLILGLPKNPRVKNGTVM